MYNCSFDYVILMSCEIQMMNGKSRKLQEPSLPTQRPLGQPKRAYVVGLIVFLYLDLIQWW